MYFINKNSSFLLPGIDQTNQVCNNDDQGRKYQNCNFHDLWDRHSCARMWSYKSYSENALFEKKEKKYLPQGIDQTNQVCSNHDHGMVYQNSNVHDPWRKGSCARACSYKF